MQQLKSLSFIILAGVLLTGCSSSKKDFETLPYQTLYNKAQTYLKDENYSSAIRYLEAIDGNFKYNAHRAQTQLDLMYSYYQTKEYYKVIEVAERFARNNPNSTKMDYVYYLVGLSNVRLGDNFIQDFFKVNRSSRAIKSTRDAYGNFQVIANNFPNSKYAAEAKQWMVYLKNRLAEHELEIVKYYQKREAYVAIVNRIEEMLRYFPDSKATIDALPYLKNAFEKMGIKDSAQKTADLIKSTEKQKFKTPKKPAYRESF
ncbi:outer membrane protein assembly factor BamD [Pasteurella atlantica]|uniref:Outer membrane protein assembly factor BamD n=2 Tax=Pasteurellaceae TaxID=712 RepID=A0ACC6HM21_9PAST|nr:outer membrane protein assembly factor BamD [Pasteurella atlantica]MDP8051853.1 outer membrane protein assembly factor BamD [Pasteurella atlantica]MDP8100694.1 outer membrane protein assembly factor BamD [Pasteurella atlantica]MDP8105315.1 outer membrane protein assembly factor BamD [Pasteurella atlantica]MDP8148427.1 outer membrane protein assembly factor BamD [Pasteurella atlantica]